MVVEEDEDEKETDKLKDESEKTLRKGTVEDDVNEKETDKLRNESKEAVPVENHDDKKETVKRKEKPGNVEQVNEEEQARPENTVIDERKDEEPKVKPRCQYDLTVDGDVNENENKVQVQIPVATLLLNQP